MPEYLASLKKMEDVIAQLRKESLPVYTATGDDPKPYENSVATANRLYRFARPDCVVLPENAEQVCKIVSIAKANNVKITIKCNGHSYAGHSTADTGIALDLRRMQKFVKLDENEETITMDAGCQWGRVYKELVNNRKDGWIANGGRCPNVGVSGFTLGAGLGPFTRSFGMGSDTLLEAKIVTAQGKEITVKASDRKSSDKGRLFWALCGAGGGNFGVVTQLKMKIQKLSGPDANGRVVSGRYTWYPKAGPDKGKTNLDKNGDFISTMNNFYTANWPDRMTIDSTWVCEPAKVSEGGPKDGVRFIVYFDGTKREFDSIIDKHIAQRDLSSMLKQRSMPEPSTRFLHETLVDQWAEETKRAEPNDTLSHIYSSFVFTNDRVIIRQVTEIVRELTLTFRTLFGNDDAVFNVTWIHSGGKAKKPERDTAFFWRDAAYHVYATIEWKDKWLENNMWVFLNEVKGKLRPYSLNKVAAFINFPDNALKDDAYEEAYFGKNVDELRKVKKIWDPEAFFMFSQGIKLPGSSKRSASAAVDEGDTDHLTDRFAKAQWGRRDTIRSSGKYSTQLSNDLDELEEAGY
jgi:hypothetical protein